MIIALVGSSSYVTGSNSATVIAGPIPGSTPTAVPITTPSRASSRLTGVAAVANPSSEELEAVHHRIPCKMPAGSATPNPIAKP